MEVILKTDVEGLGKPLQLVKVKNGYAHNYLFPRDLAILASKSNKKELEKERDRIKAAYEKEKATAKIASEKLKDASVTIAAKVSDGEKLYGSIAASDIAVKLKEKGFDIDKKKVIMESPIKQLGMYTVKVQIHAEVETNIKVWVINDESN